MSQAAKLQLAARTTQQAKSGSIVSHRPSPEVGQSPLFAGAGYSSDGRLATAGGWNFASVSVLPSSASRSIVQAKLVVGSAHDPLEREADAAADRVMRMGDPSSTLTGGLTTDAAARVQRLCASCDAEDDERQTLRRSVGSLSLSTIAPSPLVGDVVRSAGVPLDTATRHFMESRFRHDFSRVRVHADPTAAESARQMNARAYTVGGRIVFGEGQYAPSSASGRHLLAHELAHTVQQEHAGGDVVRRSEVDDAPRFCKGLKDLEGFIDSFVNAKLEEARAAAGAEFEDRDSSDHRNFLSDVKRLAAELENVLEDSSDAYRPPDLSGTKYEDVGAAPAPGRLGSVVNVGGVCVGSDKFGHFFADAYNYFKNGQTDDEAQNEAIDDEIGASVGLGLTGVFSNADIAADLAGREFYVTLDDDPFADFSISTYITSEWNERHNPSYYTKGVGTVVWKNLLEGRWSGKIALPDGTWDIQVVFANFDGEAKTVVGIYTERSIPDDSDSSSPQSRGGDVSADVSLRTKKVEGAKSKAHPVSGLRLDVTFLSVDDGLGRTGWLLSRDEDSLYGEWEDSSGDTVQGGSWWLKKE